LFHLILICVLFKILFYLSITSVSRVFLIFYITALIPLLLLQNYNTIVLVLLVYASG